MRNDPTRRKRQVARALERQAFQTGDWGEWESAFLPEGIPGSSGWCRKVRRTFRNRLYAVLVRPIGRVNHLAIRTISSLEPPWKHKQRIKNELFGEEFVALEIMPAQSKLVDEAHMYHIWVLPPGTLLPFGLKDEEFAS